MVPNKVLGGKKNMNTCQAHPELLKLVTEVNIGLNYLQLGQDEMKVTLIDLKNSQQKVLLDIQSILGDAKDFTRNEIDDLTKELNKVKDKLKSISAIGVGITLSFAVLEFLFKTGLIKLGAK
jgi:hypothetical protein